jgi:catechol 2,3-dioxygenase-like lactoylglutathione lyase family enzyme
MMLKDKTSLAARPSSAIVAVSDIDRAKAFYGETLGFEVEQDMDDAVTYKSGPTSFTVYKSEFAGTNKANAVVWDGGQEFDQIVAELRERGVTFEEYPDMGMDIDRGIHSQGEFKAVWFKDPDGNILHINKM